MTVKKIEANLSHGKGRYAIVAGRFNNFIVEHLVNGAVDGLVRHGIEAQNITITWVPGAFEMPLAVKRFADSKSYDAVLALGAVIRGSTPHFDYVAGECTKGLAQIALQSGKPVAFGLLTTDTIEQAIERAGTKAGNKGFDAAMSALEMVGLLEQLPK